MSFIHHTSPVGGLVLLLIPKVGKQSTTNNDPALARLVYISRTAVVSAARSSGVTSYHHPGNKVRKKEGKQPALDRRNCTATLHIPHPQAGIAAKNE